MVSRGDTEVLPIEASTCMRVILYAAGGLLLVIALVSHVSNHPELIGTFHDAAVKICSLDSIVYEPIRSTIKDPDAVALFDSTRQG